MAKTGDGMSDETKMPATQQGPEIVDPSEVDIVFADWVISTGIHNGVVNLALGTIDHSRKASEADMAKVVVAARLRFSRDFGIQLHAMLGRMLGLSSEDEPTQGNENPPQKPMMN